MATIEKTQSVNVNGRGIYLGVQRFTSRHLARVGDMYEGQNVDFFDAAGKAKLGRKGYSAKGSTIGEAIRGLHGHILNDGTEVPIAIAGDNAYVWDGSAWSNSGSTTLTGIDGADFTSFLNRAIMTDGTQTLSSADGLTWDSTLFTSAPANCLYIESFGTRIILADKSTIYWSSLPNSSLDDVTWNTVEQNVVPETDDGDWMTGIKRLRKRLLVFKNFSVQRMFLNGDLEPDLLVIDEAVGCPVLQKKGVVDYGGIAYFFGTTRDGEQGIFQTNGESVDLISRPVQDIIRAVPQSSYQSIRAGIKNGMVKFFIGNIVLDGQSIVNCELEYSIRDQGWQYRSLDHAITEYAPMKVGGENGLYMAGSTGLVFEDEASEDFNGNAINSVLTTHYIDVDDIDRTGTTRELYITGENLQSATFQITGIGNPTGWKTLNNKLQRSDLFKGLLLKEGSAIKIRIATNKKGVEVHKIKIRKVAERGGGEEIYG